MSDLQGALMLLFIVGTVGVTLGIGVLVSLIAG